MSDGQKWLCSPLFSEDKSSELHQAGTSGSVFFHFALLAYILPSGLQVTADNGIAALSTISLDKHSF